MDDSVDNLSQVVCGSLIEDTNVSMPQFKTDFGLHYMAACNDNYNLCAPQEAGDSTPGSQIEYRRIHKNDKKKLKKSGSQKSILKNEPSGQNDNLSNFKRDIEVNRIQIRPKPDPNQTQTRPKQDPNQTQTRP